MNNNIDELNLPSKYDFEADAIQLAGNWLSSLCRPPLDYDQK